MTRQIPMCVSWLDRSTGKTEWCATKGGKLDPGAWSDPTKCGQFVIMRHGHRKRYPTCPECRRKIGLET